MVHGLFVRAQKKSGALEGQASEVDFREVPDDKNCTVIQRNDPKTYRARNDSVGTRPL